MTTAEHVLLRVWREACQHIEVERAAAGVAAILAERAPLERLVVHRLGDDQHAAVAVTATVDEGVAQVRRLDLSNADSAKVATWARRNARADEASASPPRPLATDAASADNDARAVGFLTPLGCVGVVTFVARDGQRFGRGFDTLAPLLREPFEVAIDNDRRLHELTELREAAEADRRSLLRRLGRTAIEDRVVGEEGGLASVMKRVALVAKSDAPVLLLGETGTGKEVVGRAIHQRSDRAQGPFIRVNCGAIPPELVDSQLFGHERGAFTGANETRQGWFERASGGTLFLDEIGELPPDAQVRFLRVLQDSIVERVGGATPLAVDVRVVAATHRDLAAMVQQGTFREDLWYRIAVFPVLLPPLRDRRGDIPALAEHFAQRAARRFGLPPSQPSESDLALLADYPWPGNIRELGAVIDRAAILGEGRSLEVAAALGLAPGPGRRSTMIEESGDARDQPIDTLDAAMKRHIERALRVTGGQIEGRTGAGALLGINPHTLRARMRKLRIDWDSFRRGD